jgi:protein-S-isoprenylcysteine O-methyltransferase Ste14
LVEFANQVQKNTRVTLEEAMTPLHGGRTPRGEWYVVVQLVLFILVAIGPWLVDVQIDLPDTARQVIVVIGGVLAVIGLALVAAGILRLGRHLSPLPHPKDGAPLIQTGVYGIVRHPMYGGAIIAAVGWALVNLSPLTLVFAILLFVFFDFKSRREERWLAQTFPEYGDYRRRVRKLIPFIY